MTALTYTGKLTVATCWCGIRHAMPEELYEEAHRVGTATFCPLGHSGVWKNSENDRLRRQVADLQASLTHARDDARYQREQAALQARRAAAYKGHLTRAFNRLNAGICPVCRRNFPALGQHMRDVHPDAHEQVTAES